jgi:hypothetical protein
MLDADYFRRRLPADIADIGGGAIVEVHLLDGRYHRLRAVVEAADGYVVAEVYQDRGEDAIARGSRRDEQWGGPASASIARASLAYESIAEIVLQPVRPAASAESIGFGSR